MSPVSHVRVPFKKLSPERLDIGFYTKEYFEAISILESSNINIVEIGDIAEPWCFGAYALCNSIVWSNSNEGLPYIKAEALGSPLINFDGLTYITKETHKLLTKSQLKAGDIIVSTSGTIGLCAVIPDSIQVANSNQDTIKFNPSKKGFDNYFVVAWIASKYGQIILKREAGGAIQQHIYLSNFRRIPLLNPDRLVQNYIGDKVRLAEKLKERSKELDNKLKQLESELIPAFRPETFTKKGWQIEKKFLGENRLDPQYYKLNYVQAQQQTLGKNFINLGSVCPKMRYGISTKADYVSEEKGVLLVRGLNLTRNSLSLSKCVYLDHQHLEITKSNRLKAGELLITRSGTVGIVTVVPELLNDSIFGSFIIAMSAQKDWKPEFIAWFLNSWLGQLQVERLKNGAIQQNINIEELSSIKIWNASINVQELITDYILQWQLCQKVSNKLTTTAKYLVEALIEGKITETELKNAQTALQKGDIEPDKAILAKLTRKGYDIADEPPLFPDLDALYQATREINLTSE